MMDKKVYYSSFLLRIWQITNTDHATHNPDWVLEIESVQSGEIWKFNSLEELFLLLQAQIDGSLI